jgi:serine/threonine protein kinase
MIRSPDDVAFAKGSRLFFDNNEENGTGLPHFILREISALVDLNGHKNIIELVDIFEIKGSRKIVLSFRYEKGGDLNSLMHR